MSRPRTHCFDLEADLELILGDRPFIDPDIISAPIRLALNWAHRQIPPPDIYSMSPKWAIQTIAAYDRLVGHEIEQMRNGRGRESRGE